MKTHLVMPMGGAGLRFFENGYLQPKPLIEIHGKPFFYWAANSVARYVELADITFVVLQRHVSDFQIDKAILAQFPHAKVRVIEDVLPGPVFTCLEGIKEIADAAPVVFNDCDHLFCSTELNRALQEEQMEAAGALLTFPSSEPQFSYVRYDGQGKISGTVEKKVVSSHAICGAYVFQSSGFFRTVAEEYVRSCPYNECFLSGMYDLICRKGLKVEEFALDYHVEFGTPAEYRTALTSPYFKQAEQER